MRNDSVNLLRRLGSGVIPGDGNIAPVAVPLEDTDFPTLLVGAGAGAIRTGRAVLAHAELLAPLSMEQLNHIADAADIAQAAGVAKAAVLIDQRALTLDVPARRITSEIALDAPALRPGDVATGIEAVVVARSTIEQEQAREQSQEAREGDGAPEFLAGPQAHHAARRLAARLMQIQNRSVAELLAGDPDNRRAG